MRTRHLPITRTLAPLLLATVAWTGCGDVGDGARDAVTTDVPDPEAIDDALEDGTTPDAPEAPDPEDDAPSQDVYADAGEDTGPGACPPVPPVPGQVRARAVACVEELATGYHAVGRVGDFLLENAVARFVVRGPGEGHALLGLWGGGLVDAVGPNGQDQLRELQPLLSFNVLRPDRVEITRDGRDGEAIVSVHGTPVGHPVLESVVPGIDLDADIVHEYVLHPDEPFLRLRTRVRPVGTAPVEVTPGDLNMLGGNMKPFVPGTKGELDVAIAGPFFAAAGGGASYAYVAGQSVNGLEVGGSEILLSDAMVATADAEAVFERVLVVGDGSVSSVVDVAWDVLDVPTADIAGIVRVGDTPAGAGCEVLAYDDKGRRRSIFRTAVDGTFSGRLPLGRTDLIAACPGSTDGTPMTVDLTATGLSDLDMQTTEPSFLEVTARETAEGAPVPARASIESLDAPGARPRFVFTGPGIGRFPLAPGQYRVTVSRGPEYERVVEDPVTIAAGQTVPLDAVLERVVSTPGAIAAEFHIHCESSVDSAVPVADRVAACASEGLEFVVASDHDFVTDYGPALTALGLDPYMTSVPGCEVSSVVAGHFQSWPHPVVPDQAGNGAPRWFGLSPPALTDLLRSRVPDGIVQVNHPRFGADSTFDIIRFDPADGLAHADPVSLGFPEDTDLSAMPYDAIEVFNGIGDEELDEQLADWFALLNGGHRITATAGGDSHELSSFPGNPRNLVFLGTDDPAAATAETVRAALKAMRILVTSGPYVEAGLLRPEGGEASLPGDLVTDTDGEVALHVSVQAPTWMDVDEVVVVRNGVAGAPIPLPAPAPGEDPPIVRYNETIPLSADADTWFVVIVRGNTRDRVMANVLPIAITNPFFVDADGDAAFTPPGLPAR